MNALHALLAVLHLAVQWHDMQHLESAPRKVPWMAAAWLKVGPQHLCALCDRPCGWVACLLDDYQVGRVNG